jgi:surface antigen
MSITPKIAAFVAVGAAALGAALTGGLYVHQWSATEAGVSLPRPEAGVVSLTAATPAYFVLADPALNERSGPSTSAPIIGSLPYHSGVFIACQTTGSAVNGSVIWDHLTNGAYVSDWYVSTPAVGAFSAGLARCGTPTPSPAPSARLGLTAEGDQGYPGQCTWWADNEFHAYSGVWPDFVWSVDSGNARYWAENAAHNGWSVTSTPEPNSIAVFQPGENGAFSEGHVAWVTAVDGNQITISEMNGTAGPYRVDLRTIVPSSGVRYILAPAA